MDVQHRAPRPTAFRRPTGKVARNLPLVAIFLFALNCDVLPLRMTKRDGADMDDLCFAYPSDGKKAVGRGARASVHRMQDLPASRPGSVGLTSDQDPPA